MSHDQNAEFISVVDTRVFKKSMITSYSVILHSIIKGDIYYLIAKVRDTIPFKEFLKCNIEDDEMAHYINYMSMREKQKILTQSFEEVLNETLVHRTGKAYRRSKELEWKFHDNVKRHYKLLTNTSIGLKNVPYIFPKGRKEEGETERECALRELEEETRIKRSLVSLYDIDPFEETYVGINGKLYKTIYFVGFIDYKKFKLEMSDIKSNYIVAGNRISLSEEIDAVYWLQYNDAIKKLDNPKQYILQSVNTYLLFNLTRNTIKRRHSF